MPLRMIYFGTTEFSRHMLEEVLSRDEHVAAVYSLAREHAGGVPDWRDLGELTRTRGIEHHELTDAPDARDVAHVAELKPDATLMMGWPVPAPPQLLSIPRLGTIRSHPALLPRNRGQNPIPAHILTGETQGGLTFYLAGERPYEGPIVSQRRFKITLTDTARTLTLKTIAAGREMMTELFPMLKRGQLETAPQDESKATYLPEVRDEERRIDWKQNARRIYDIARAWTEPYAGAFCFLGSRKLIVWEAGFSHEPVDARPGEIVKISDRGVEVATAAGLIVLRKVQIAEEPEHALDVFERSGAQLGSRLT